MYDLVCDDITRKANLTGKESIAEMIKKFTCDTMPFASNLKKNDTKTPENIKKRQEQICTLMQCILSDVCLPSEALNKERSLECIAAAHICLDFGFKYDEISTDLFNLQRRLGGHYYSGMPLFVDADLKSDGEWRKSWNDKSVSSNMPPITRKAKESARLAKADFLQAYLNALKTPVLGDWILSKEEDFLKSLNFGLKVYWIPSEENLKVEVNEKDPLLIANIYKRKFLVAKWDVEGEEPYEHYLAEYKVR